MLRSKTLESPLTPVLSLLSSNSLATTVGCLQRYPESNHFSPQVIWLESHPLLCAVVFCFTQDPCSSPSRSPRGLEGLASHWLFGYHFLSSPFCARSIAALSGTGLKHLIHLGLLYSLFSAPVTLSQICVCLTTPKCHPL